jgi:hypothetical protein
LTPSNAPDAKDDSDFAALQDIPEYRSLVGLPNL